MEKQDEVKNHLKLSFMEWIIATLMAGCVVIVFMQVIFRYLLHNSLIWSEELSRYVFCWLVFVGTGMAFGDNSHIMIDFAVSYLRPGARRIVTIFDYIISLVFLAVACWYGIQMVKLTGGTRSPAAGLPLNIVFYAAMPTGTFIGLLFVIRNLYREITRPGRT